MKKIIFFLFAFLIFFVPIVLWPFTSEVFEFNKIVLTYILTTLIASVWFTRCIVERKFIFRRTILDIPLLIFLGSQVISTLLSIDIYTSIFGYYSRFNGGLTSTICYLILYWAFVSNFNVKDVINLIKIWFASAVLVSTYGVLEHFGIDKKIWVQDVQSRVFSTLGQPNWLAAWVVALIPVAWAFMLKEKIKSINFWIYFAISVLLFWTLIFTKSRSGFLGFGIACLIFWRFIAVQNIKNLKSIIAPLFIAGFAFVAICLISGTQWTPSLKEYFSHQKAVAIASTGSTALETGGTESGVIREIVWTGAIKLWEHYPIFGTGVETFGYSYYFYRPAAHNLTSEWDYIYNKAHNQFLNYAANSGTVGLLSYLVVIGVSIFIFIRNLKSKDPDSSFSYLEIAFLAGYVSLSVSNFFGFSVVPTDLQFFIFPAIAISLLVPEKKVGATKNLSSNNNINPYQKTGFVSVGIIATIILWLTVNYWNADILYSRAKALNAIPRPDLAIPVLTEAINLEPSQAIYYSEIANSYAMVAVAYAQIKDATNSSQFVDLAILNVQKSIDLAPSNINLRRSEFGVYIRLTGVDGKYLSIARDSLNKTVKMAPTDPKLFYDLAVTNVGLRDYADAITDFQTAVTLKPDYNQARIEYASLLAQLARTSEARDQLNYILMRDPTNEAAKAGLANLGRH